MMGNLQIALKKACISIFVLSIFLLSGHKSFGALSGTYTINPGLAASSTNYQSFASAVADLQSGSRTSLPTGCTGGVMDAGTTNGPGVSGAVTFQVATGTYTEQILLSAVSGTSSTNKIVFSSAANDSTKVTMTYTVAAGTNYVVKLSGCSFTTFKYMTFKNITATNGNCIIFDNAAATSNNTFTNNQFVQNLVTTISTSIVGLGVTTAPSSSGNISINNTVSNNYFLNGSYGIYFQGYSGGYVSGMKITGNLFVNQGAMPIFLTYLDGVQLVSNTMLLTSAPNATWVGITLTNLTASSRSNNISRNKIAQTAQGTTSNTGIAITNVAGSSTNPTTIFNNSIKLGTNSSIACTGISATTTSPNLRIYFNTIYINSTFATATTVYGPIALTNLGSSNNLEIKNNLLANVGTSTTAAMIRFVDLIANYSTGAIDYNFYSTPTTATNHFLYINATSGTPVVNTFTAWKTSTTTKSFDLNSAAPATTNLGFYSVTNGDLRVTDPSALIRLKGQLLSSLNSPPAADNDGETRPTGSTKPCIGFDEFATGADAAIIGVTAPASFTNLSSTAGTSLTVTVANWNPSASLTAVTIYYGKIGTTLSSYSATVSISAGSTGSVTIPSSFTFPNSNGTFIVKTGSPNGGADANPYNDSFKVAYTSQMSGTYTLGGATGNYGKFADLISDMTSRTVGGPITVNVNAGTFTEQVVISAITGVSATNTITFDGGTGNAATRILTSVAASPNYTLQIKGASYYTFKNLTLRRTGASGATNGCVVQILANAAVPSSFNNIQNCILTGISAAPYTAPNVNTTANTFVAANDALINVGTVAADYICASNSFQNNTLNNGSYGVYLWTSSTTNFMASTTVSGNSINNSSIAGIFAQNQTGAVISANTIDGVGAASTANVLYGIYAQGCTNITIGGATSPDGNVIAGTTNFYGTGVETGIYCYYGNLSSTFAPGGVIRYNTVTGLSGTGAIGIFSNAIGISIRNNTVQNFTSGTTGGASVTAPCAGIMFNVVSASAGTPVINDNTISGFTGAGTTTSNGYIYGIIVNGTSSLTATSPTISGNTISFSGTPAAGIYVSYAKSGGTLSTLVISKNKLYLPSGAYNTNTAATGGAGIVLTNILGTSSTPAYIANNMITLGGTTQAYGIREYSTGATSATTISQYVNFFYNSIFISNTYDQSTGTAQNSSGGMYLTGGFSFISSTAAYTDSVVNNNIVLNTGGSGGGYAIGIINPYNNANGVPGVKYMNYNNYYCPNSTYMGVWISGNGTTTVKYSPALSSGTNNWQSVSSQEAGSIAIDPAYVSTGTGNLHAANASLNRGLGRASGAAATVILTDYDAVSRPLSPGVSTIGVNQYYTTGLDAGVTAIGPLMPFTSGSQTVTATVVNYGSVTLTAVTISWTVNGTGYSNSFSSLSIPSGSSSTLSLSAITFSVGTTYTIIAATTSPNGGTDLLTTNDAKTVVVVPSMSGTYYIDASVSVSGDGSSGSPFKAFNDAVSALGGGITGAITFNVAAGTYTERVELTPPTGLSSTNTITFDGGTGNAATRILTYSAYSASSPYAPYTLRLNGMQYVTLKNLTIKAANASMGWAVDIYTNTAYAGGGSNNTIQNCIIMTNAGVSTTNPSFVGILVGPAVDVTVPTFSTNVGNLINNNTINNNTITGGWGGIIWEGSGGTATSNSVISGNKINKVGQYGMYFYNQKGSTTIGLNVYNNFIGGGFLSTASAGIFSHFGSAMNIWHNSINLDASTTAATGACIAIQPLGTTPSGGISIGGSASAYKIGNNQLIYSAVGGSGAPLAIYYAGLSGSGASLSNCLFDYNNFYNSASTAMYNAGGGSTTLVVYDVSTFQGGGGQNSNSVNLAPTFVSNTDLHVQDKCVLGDVPPAYITTDIDGNTRSNPPVIGADEPVVATVGNDLSANWVPVGVAGSTTVEVRLKNMGNNQITSGTVSYSVNGGLTVSRDFTATDLPLGYLDPCDSATVTFSGSTGYSFTSGAYQIKAWVSNPNGSSSSTTTDSNAVNDTAYSSTFYLPLSGTYTIDAASSGSRNFKSFTLAINALTGGGISGPVQFDVADGVYNEQLAIGNISGVTSWGDTVLFQGASHDSTKVLVNYNSFSSANYVLLLNATQFVSFRHMTFQALNSTYSEVIGISAAASYNTITNCRLIGASNASTGTVTTQSIVYSSNSGVNRQNNFFNNVFVGNFAGIYYQNYNIIIGSNLPSANIVGNTFTNQYAYGIFCNQLLISEVSGNTITTNSPSTTYFGINLPSASSGGTSAIIVRNNKISGAVGGTGIFLSGGGASGKIAQVYNNTIQIGSSSNSALGINTSATYTRFFHNTVNVTSGNSAGYAFQATSAASSNVDIKDNIFVNSGNGTSAGGAINLNAFANYLACNYNLYYAAGATSSTGTMMVNAATAYTFNGTSPSWRSVTSLDANSQVGNPGFYSSSDLHVTDPNSIISNIGTTVTGVSTDFEGQTRPAPGKTNPCIGADEFTPAPVDAGIVALISPVSGYCAGSQNVRVRVKNFGTTAITAGTMATIYLAINHTSSIAYSWTVGSTLAVNDTITVNIGSASFPAGTPLIADSISLSGDGNHANDSLLTTNVSSAMGGTYTIGGSGSDYLNFSGAVSDLNTRGMCSAVTFNIASGTYNEQVSLGSVTGASAINTVTFQSATPAFPAILANPTSSLSTGNYTLRISGGAWYIIKDMGIRRTGASAYGRTIDVSGTSHDNQILNNTIIGATTTNSGNNQAVIYSGADNDNNNTFKNNTISRGSAGFYLNGVSSASLESGLLIENNTIDSASAYGIYVSFEDSAIIKKNIVTNIGAGTTNTVYGASINYCNNGSALTNNKFDVLVGGFGLSLTNCSGLSTEHGSVINNLISIASPSTGSTLSGLYLQNNAYQDIYFNSVNVYNTNAGQALSDASSSGSNNNVVNNIFANSGGNFAANLISASYITLNYNDLYTTGSNLGKISTSSLSNLSAWQTATSQDAASISADPIFIAANNLHAGSVAIVGAGQSISGITTDYDLQTRSATPCIGGDEFSGTDAGITAIAALNPYCGSSSQNVTVTLKNYGATTLTSVTINLAVNGTNQISYSWTGSLASNATTPVNIGSASLTTGISQLDARTSGPNGGVDGNAINDSFVSQAGSGLSGTLTIGASGADYASFTDAVTDLKARGVCGALTFNVANGTYFEQVSLNSISGASSTNTITFQSASTNAANVILAWPCSSGSSSNYTLQFNGSKFISFKYITIRRTGLNTYGNVVEIKGGSRNIVLRDNILIGPKTTATGFNQCVIYSAQDNDSNTLVHGNAIKDGTVGIYMNGANSSSREDSTLIENNIIDSCSNYGIFARYQNELIIRNNIMDALGHNTANAVYGIYLSNCNNSLSISANSANNVSGGYGLYISNCTATTGTHGTIVNNMFSLSNASNVITPAGIYSANNTYQDFGFNTVLVYATNSGYAFLDQSSSGGNNSIRNCIFANTGGGFALSITTGSYFGTINYNDYYVTGSSLGKWNGSTLSSISAWRTASSKDANTVSTNPVFTSQTNINSNSCLLKFRGTNISGITTDINAATRPSTPDPGANQVVSIAGRWTGLVSDDWFSSANWCDNTIPSCAGNTSASIQPISISGATVNYPLISGGTANVKNLTIGSGATLTLNTQVDICGDFTNSGTLSGGTASVIHLNGSNQTISGGTYRKVKISGTGVKTLATSDITITDTLQMLSGVFLTDTLHNRKLTLGSGARISENDTSYVVGKVQTQRTLSVSGGTQSFGEIGVEVTQATGATDAGVTVITRRTGTAASTLQHGTRMYKGINMQWDITPTTNSNLQATIVFHYNPGMLNGIVDSVLSVFADHTGSGIFDYEGRTGTVNTALHTVTSPPTNTFSDWTLGGSFYNPLPVEMISFEARLQNESNARLEWITAQEINNEKYIIERSEDGANWKSVGEKAGMGTTQTVSNYTYMDNFGLNLNVPFLYYRLKQVDYNGAFTYSVVRKLVLSNLLQADALKTWYNKGEDKLYANISRSNSTHTIFRLSDLQGKVVVQESVTLDKGLNQVSISMGELKKGVYFLTVIDGNSVETTRILKY